jgi:hypothetical protein
MPFDRIRALGCRMLDEVHSPPANEEKLAE